MKVMNLFTSILCLLCFAGFFAGEKSLFAQVTSGPVPTPGAAVSHSSPDEEFLMRRVSEIAQSIESEMKQKAPEWKLIKKAPGFSNGLLPVEKGGGPLKAATSSLWFENGKTEAYINFGIAEPSTVEEVAERFKLSQERRARGISKQVNGIGNEAVISMDDPGAPSTAARFLFRKERFSVAIGITDQSRKREQNEKDAIKLGTIIEPLIH